MKKRAIFYPILLMILLHTTGCKTLVSHRTSMKIMTYNVAIFMRDSMYPLNYKNIAAGIHEQKADVICLNELDSMTTRTQHEYQLKQLASFFPTYEYKFAKAMDCQGGSYGDGILYRAKCLNQYTIPLPKAEGTEPRVMAVIETPSYIIASVHLDVEEKAHHAQINAINNFFATHFKHSDKPIFLGGDLNAHPLSETLKTFGLDWVVLSEQSPTYPALAPNECLDYILWYKHSRKVKLQQTQVIKNFKSSNIKNSSDHLPVMVEVIF